MADEKIEVEDTSVKEVKQRKTKKEKEEDMLGRILGHLEDLGGQVADIGQRVHDLETGGVDQFKREARPEDIASAESSRQGVDPKIVGIVNEMLGEDFGIEVRSLDKENRPGFRLTIIVPPRLSDATPVRRPIYELDENGNPTQKYAKDEFGNVLYEEYLPDDRRSRILSSSESYDSVRQHCERVRGYIVAHFQRNNKPLPEFRVT